MIMIKDLKDIKLNETEVFGGKACNLGHLIQNGFNVPQGFCIGVETEKSHLVIDKFKELGVVSVRSSATCEDSEFRSFAGQFDTFLNIDNEKDLMHYIKKCKESANSERVKAYAGNMKIKMAVIVQKMIDAEFSGVMFTEHPVSKKGMLIEAAKGIGDKVVSGLITPSFFEIDKNITRKQDRFNLDEVVIMKIAKIGKEIEALYKKPQDIEFSVKKKIFILQSRPITT